MATVEDMDAVFKALADPAAGGCSTYIKTTPERLWRALTEPEFIRQYFEDTGPRSDWRVGVPVLWRMDPAADYQDWDQQVLVSEPNRRLAYTWHNYRPEMAEMFGWSDEQLAELQKERRSKVTFDIEPATESTASQDTTRPRR